MINVIYKRWKMMGELLIIRQCCNEDCKDSVFGRFECYFSLERKVTKSSRLNRLHCSGERLHSKIRNSLCSNNGFS